MRQRKHTLKKTSKIRIIAGKWRGRKIPVADLARLRPTPDRVRETVFNWLQSYIVDAKCLDLFSGTGVLGIESLSRGAQSATFVEQNSKTAATLRGMLKILDVGAMMVWQADALQWLTASKQQFDIIFLDPPFGMNLLGKSLSLLVHSKCIHAQTIIYIESEKDLQPATNFEVMRKACAGQVHYGLLKIKLN